MIRRHPGVSVAMAVYLLGLVLFVLVPWRGYANGTGVARMVARLGLPTMPGAVADLVVNAMVFLPLGVLLAVLVGRRRWATGVGVAVLVACWVELAQAVWLPERNPSMACVAAQVIGATIGATVVGLITARTATPARARQEAALAVEARAVHQRAVAAVVVEPRTGEIALLPPVTGAAIAEPVPHDARDLEPLAVVPAWRPSDVARRRPDAAALARPLESTGRR